MREPEVVADYVRWLEGQGWTCTIGPNGDYPDVDATHPEHGRLIAEAKGLTKDSGTSSGIGYGQLLRRISNFPDARFAYMVPAGQPLEKALRVSAAVRAGLGIGLHVVDQDGSVRVWEKEQP